MTKHQMQNIPMKMIQKALKQTRHLQFPTLLTHDEIVEVINSLIQNKVKTSVWFMHRLKIMLNIMDMMLNQCTYFFQALEG